ncbi:MAG: ATP-binding protein, partial [Desulfuromonadales bacterium]|nr:ATP-binding protein [Desulfuromonadales bacterium]
MLPTGPIDLVQYLSRKLKPLAIGIALLITVLAPVTFWLHAHSNLQNMAALYAEDLAAQLRLVALESPALWKYQTYKFTSITDGFHPLIDVSGFRVLDEKGELVIEQNYSRPRWKKPGENLSVREKLTSSLAIAPIIFNDRQIGTLEVLADDFTILRATTIILSLSALFGIVLGLLVYLFPVLVIRKMARKMEELIIDLRHSEDQYSRLNAELELKVEARTKQLIEVQEELVRKEKLSILGQLSGSVGHELRNPLGVMSNAVYFLKMVHGDADTTTKEYLEIIKNEIDNSLRIITDLLDFARTRPPQRQSVSATELVRKSLERCVIPENVTLTVTTPEEMPPLHVDPEQIEQVLINFISNGVQALPEGGGTLQVAARLVGAPPCGCPEAGGHGGPPLQDGVAISVTDSGTGIAPENMKNIFQPLFTTKTKGIGLGLVVCKNLVEANGGTIK